MRFCLLLVIAFLTGCTSLGGHNLPTTLPTEYIPTVIALTVEARDLMVSSPQISETPENISRENATIEPATGVTQTPTSRASVETATALPTVASNTLPPHPEIPLATIQFLTPGPLSKVTSSFFVRAYLPPGPTGVVRVELLGEDGRLLMREVKRYNVPIGTRVTVGSEITFQIAAAAEASRLQISVEDENGQTITLASVDLILLSLGESDINPPGDQLEEIVIQEPSPNALIQGGTVRVAGLARPRSSQPLMIELRNAQGKNIGSRQVAVQPTPDGHHGSFAIDVPYTVSAPSRARLFVWEPGERVPGIVHLSSLEVTLSP